MVRESISSREFLDSLPPFLVAAVAAAAARMVTTRREALLAIGGNANYDKPDA